MIDRRKLTENCPKFIVNSIYFSGCSFQRDVKETATTNQRWSKSMSRITVAEILLFDWIMIIQFSVTILDSWPIYLSEYVLQNLNQIVFFLAKESQKKIIRQNQENACAISNEFILRLKNIVLKGHSIIRSHFSLEQRVLWQCGWYFLILLTSKCR